MLELSKLHVYDFHYNHMKVKYPRVNQLRLLFTDTDSLAYVVQTDGIYKDIAIDAADRYDFSEYPLDHPLYDASNRKALGFLKDELNSVPTREFVGLRPNCYAIHCTGKTDKNVLQHMCSKTITCILHMSVSRISYHHLLTLFVLLGKVNTTSKEQSYCSFQLIYARL